MFRTIDTPYDLSAFSPQQLYRIKWKLRERMLKGMGWQPFGLDSSTLWACYPGFMRAIESVNLHGIWFFHS